MTAIAGSLDANALHIETIFVLVRAYGLTRPQQCEALPLVLLLLCAALGPVDGRLGGRRLALTERAALP